MSEVVDNHGNHVLEDSLSQSGDWRETYSADDLKYVPSLRYKDGKPCYAELSQARNNLFQEDANTPEDLYEATAPTYPEHRANIVSEIRTYGFDPERSNTENLEIIFTRIAAEIVAQLFGVETPPTYSRSQQTANAELVNRTQHETFFDQDYDQKFAQYLKNMSYGDESIQAFIESTEYPPEAWQKFNEKRRRLVFFTRHALYDHKNSIEPYGDINNIEMAAFYWGINWYLQRALSPLYGPDDLYLVSRIPGYYPHFLANLIDNFKYENVTGYDFETFCGLYANKVGLSHSSNKYSVYPAAMAATGTSIRRDKCFCASHVQVPIPLNFDRYNQRDPLKTNHQVEGETFEGSLQECIRTGILIVIELERTVLGNTQKGQVFNTDIDS